MFKALWWTSSTIPKRDIDLWSHGALKNLTIINDLNQSHARNMSILSVTAPNANAFASLKPSLPFILAEYSALMSKRILCGLVIYLLQCTFLAACVEHAINFELH